MRTENVWLMRWRKRVGFKRRKGKFWQTSLEAVSFVRRVSVCVRERERERERERKSERERKKIDASPRNVAFPRETSIGWCFVHFTVRSTSTLRSHTVL